MHDKGVIFVATGLRYAEVALLAIDYLRRVEPDVPVTIFTDRDSAAAVAGRLPAGVSTAVLENPTYDWFDKIPAFRDTPYRRTIYLDVDVIAIRPFVDELMQALAIAPILARSAGIAFNFPWETAEYPRAIPQYNTGVVAYDVDRVAPALSRWGELRGKGEGDGGGNQPTFRAALLDCGLYPSELPVSYNFMEYDGAVEPVRLVHFVASKDVLMNPARRERRLAFVRDLETPCRVIHGAVWLNRRKNVPWSAFVGLLRYKVRIRIKKIFGRSNRL